MPEARVPKVSESLREVCRVPEFEIVSALRQDSRPQVAQVDNLHSDLFGDAAAAGFHQGKVGLRNTQMPGGVLLREASTLCRRAKLIRRKGGQDPL